jgi:hypothetical protein
MPRFTILAAHVPVGHSELEAGDAPMGGAFGRFFPLPAYDTIRSKAVAARDATQEHLELELVDDAGSSVPAQGGVQIVDYVDEIGPTGIEVHVLGIPYPRYAELFPGHVRAYELQFKSDAR